MKDRIAKRAVDALEPGEFIADTEIKGFIARRLPSGAVTYAFQYRTDDGKRPWISLGRHGNITADEARRLAKKRAGEVADDRDPAAERDAERVITVNTVNAVLDSFIERYLRRNKLRNLVTIESAFNRLVRPVIGDRSIYHLTRKDMAELFDGIEDNNGPVMADRTLAYLRKAFNWQMTRDQAFTSPIIKGMARTKPSERQRQRILDGAEICDLWNALDQLTLRKDVPACYPRYVRALLFTGQRRTTVALAHRNETSGGNWIIPASRMKHKKDHLHPITADLSRLFGQGRGFLFSSDGGATPFSGYSKAKAALDKKIAELRKADRRKAMPHWTLHDLRRTARSIMSRYATPDIAERVIGHVIGGVRGVYDVYEYADEKRAALEKLAKHVHGIVRKGHAASATGGSSEVELRL
jgi:integrase